MIRISGTCALGNIFLATCGTVLGRTTAELPTTAAKFTDRQIRDSVSADHQATQEIASEAEMANTEAANATAVIVDDNEYEVDEGYASSTGGTSYLTSIATSIRTGVLENGRTYPNFGKASFRLHRHRCKAMANMKFLTPTRMNTVFLWMRPNWIAMTYNTRSSHD